MDGIFLRDSATIRSFKGEKRDDGRGREGNDDDDDEKIMLKDNVRKSAVTSFPALAMRMAAPPGW
jgi:hypothetical protein